MQPHLSRLITERLDLCSKIDALYAFIWGPGNTTFPTLAVDEQEDFVAQHSEMLALATRLTGRLVRAGLSNKEMLTYPDLVSPLLADDSIHVSIRGVLQWFVYSHLPADKQLISRPFAVRAAEMVATLPRNAELTVALRKLKESKDAAVCCQISKF